MLPSHPDVEETFRFDNDREALPFLRVAQDMFNSCEVAQFVVRGRSFRGFINSLKISMHFEAIFVKVVIRVVMTEATSHDPLGTWSGHLTAPKGQLLVEARGGN